MERVRRRKLCRKVMSRAKAYGVYRKGKKRGYCMTSNGVNNVTCSNKTGRCHPYTDKINIVHALSDLLTSAEGWIFYIEDIIYAYWEDDNVLYQRLHYLQWKFLDDGNVFYRLLTEIYYADKRIIFCAEEEQWGDPLVSHLAGYGPNQKAPVCGNYIKFAEALVEMAKQSIACSKNKQDRKNHLKKLKFFMAMKRMKSIRIRTGYNGGYID